MKTFYDIFRQINAIPRPSHHEEKIADFLCAFAEEHGLKYKRDGQNCVVIEKDATPGYEDAAPVVLLNHMDMVCVSRPDYMRNGRPFDALNDEIRPYIEEVRKDDGTITRWMKAEGTSLGADNGIGLSMALAVLADDSIIHPAIEVLTTTNEEDGMSGAEALSTDFIRGRKIINLDSEAYNEITVGAAGACLQVGKWRLEQEDIPSGYKCFKIVVNGGLGGHSGVDINKGRCNCIKTLFSLVNDCISDTKNGIRNMLVCNLSGGIANASIASDAEIVIAIKEEDKSKLDKFVKECHKSIKDKYSQTDSSIDISYEEYASEKHFIKNANDIIKCIKMLPFGTLEMRKDMPDTVMTSNNIGVLKSDGEYMTLSCHTRSFDNDEQRNLSDSIRQIMTSHNAIAVDRLMDTAAWVERPDSPLLALTCKTFNDILGFEPKKVAMHFVLEAAYYVEKYPGVEIASIGPLIIEPHSTSERVNLDTADNIWKVTVELLRRLAEM